MRIDGKMLDTYLAQKLKMRAAKRFRRFRILLNLELLCLPFFIGMGDSTGCPFVSTAIVKAGLGAMRCRSGRTQCRARIREDGGTPEVRQSTRCYRSRCAGDGDDRVEPAVIKMSKPHRRDGKERSTPKSAGSNGQRPLSVLQN